jgi:ATP-dependent helicase/nuclease subunit A
MIDGPHHAPADGIVLPPDQVERLRLREELTRTLFVEAGAGSGKTSEMVERITALVLSGTLGDIATLAAITFTEAAAAELRNRVRERLERAEREAPAGSVQQRRAGDALERLDEAAIATLHGFAFRLLSELPVEAGLPPGFAVLDDISAAIEARAAWDVFLDELFADASMEPALRRAFTMGLRMSQLSTLSAAFADNWDRLEVLDLAPFVHAVSAIDDSTVIAAVRAAAEAAVAAAQQHDSKTAPVAAEAYGRLDAALRAEPDPERRIDLFLQHEGVGGKWGGVKKPALVEARDRSKDADDQIQQLLADLRLDAIEPLVARVASFTLVSARLRQQRGEVSYHDLLVLCRRMLRADAGARRELARRHRLLLVDEFQDTDPLQIEIVLLLALRDPDVCPSHWAEAEVEDGRLFFVGDPKQSIYRFRRADLTVFQQVRERFADAAAVELSANFRTVPGVLAFVNGLFAPLFGSEPREGQPAYQELAAARPAGPVTAPVAVVGGPVDVPNVAALRALEAEELAEVIAGFPVDGTTVTDPVSGQVRPARLADVAILLPTRAMLGELERSLDARGVPSRVESRSLVFGTDEVTELLAILRAIDDPNDAVAVVAALRSPAFACSDTDLARHHAGGGTWNYRRLRYLDRPAGAPDRTDTSAGDDVPPGSVPDASPDPVLAGLRFLYELHDRRIWMPVHELVEEVIRARRMVELTVGYERPRDHWRRLRLVQAEARAFVESGGNALADFVAWITQQADEQASRVEIVVSESDDDAVRILTVHGAKGLEFPIVVLAGLGAEERTRYEPVLWTADGPQIALGSQNGARFEMPGYQDAKRVDAELDLYERHRLLYVAMTRARDHLVLGLHHKPTNGDKLKSSAARIDAALAAIPVGSWRRVPASGDVAPDSGVAPEVAPSVASVAVSPGGVGDPDADAARWQAARDELLAAISRRTAVAPTALAERASREATDHVDADDLHDGRAETGGAEAGRSGGSAGSGGGAPPRPTGTEPIGASVPVRDEPGAERAAEPAEAARTASTSSGERPAADGPPPFGRLGQGGTAVGRAVHGTMQLVDLAQPDGLAELAHHQALAEGIPDRADAVERLARSALASPTVQEAIASGRWWREIFVSAPVGPSEVLVEGYIDLLFETADGRLVVVDYKTDQGRRDDELEASLARYRIQGAAYAAAVGQALGRPVDRCTFVFARTRGPAVEKTITDLADAVAEVEALVG